MSEQASRRAKGPDDPKLNACNSPNSSPQWAVLPKRNSTGLWKFQVSSPRMDKRLLFAGKLGNKRNLNAYVFSLQRKYFLRNYDVKRKTQIRKLFYALIFLLLVPCYSFEYFRLSLSSFLSLFVFTCACLCFCVCFSGCLSVRMCFFLLSNFQSIALFLSL